MRGINRTQLIKFALLAGILSFLGYLYILSFGLQLGLHSLLLTWSFFVLSTPAPNGGTLLDVPFQLLTGRRIIYSEIIVWSFALLLNALTYWLAHGIYFKTTINHLLYQILSHPWPRWIIIFVCALCTIYSSLIVDSSGKVRSSIHGYISKILTLVAILITIALSYFELIVVLNSHGLA